MKEIVKIKYIFYLVIIFMIILSGCSTNRPMPVYGCWCGPNQPESREDPYPINAWDRACREHDRCYDRRGQNNRYCDAQFLSRIETLALRYGRAPGQLQVAYGIFKSRLTGVPYIQGYFTIPDIAEIFVAGSECE